MALGSKFEENKLTNETKNITPQCKVVVYQWNSDALGFNGQNATLCASTPIDISSQIVTCDYQKNMGDPCGTFSFTLTNSPGIGSGDWKDIIKRGMWVVIYMSNDGDLVMTNNVSAPNPQANKLEEAKKIRCIGYVDRVAVDSELNDKGAFDVNYQVSGRDFGVVYEDTSIWHNLFQFDEIMLQSIATSELNIQGAVKIDKVLDTVHDLFFNPRNLPGAKVNDKGSLTTIALQWLMPKEMVRDIGMVNSGDPFWGSLGGIKRFSTTAAGLAVEKPTDYLSGNAWEQLKKVSVPELHELFTETNDSGLPGLTFRPIPFAIDKSKYPLAGQHIQLYKDLAPIVTLEAIDVVNFNLGEDNYSRYNSFLVTVSTTLINVEDNISVLKGTDYPKNIQDSIKRHGFRPMHVSVDSIVKNGQNANGEGDAKLLIEFNEVMYDYWNNAVFAETGSVNCIGNNAVKVGKVLKFGAGVPYVNGKRYYIEGYSDSFTTDDKGAKLWVQEVNLTRGFSEQDLINKSGFGDRDSNFTNEGEFTAAGVSTIGKK